MSFLQSDKSTWQTDNQYYVSSFWWRGWHRTEHGKVVRGMKWVSRELICKWVKRKWENWGKCVFSYLECEKIRDFWIFLWFFGEKLIFRALSLGNQCLSLYHSPGTLKFLLKAQGSLQKSFGQWKNWTRDGCLMSKRFTTCTIPPTALRGCQAFDKHAAQTFWRDGARVLKILKLGREINF